MVIIPVSPQIALFAKIPVFMEYLCRENQAEGIMQIIPVSSRIILLM